ncbi:NADP-dependent oxidoreductase [Epilithonimonas lactis]|uniref:NADPH:quinone oxidoreductase n=1 Tax=Epilithonimonas lactis TaxID=421072 RepID=A0A085BI79_9FLAO|nr:NADP-dependent oxidoreductase [Epilithonimonas lactis]KFC22174.1 NADPH:quinone oxidoreductase [Epilithonimonas lactis]SEQ56850.1 alcohol dehydrogenase [Epilithonimonas lactis]
MKAFITKNYSKTDKLELTEVPKPSIKVNQVLVEIHSASVNQLDSKLKSGEFKMMLPYKLPLILGHDVAGIVIEVGSKVKNLKIGDEVFSRVPDFQIGAFAEYIAIDEDFVAPKPKNISMEEAASIPLVGLTVWQAFIEKANLRKGQKVFIQAGSGGVGTFAIQLAKHLGAFVATTTSEKNIEFVKQLGADLVIDYKTQDFENILKDYDLVLNSQDQKTLEKSIRILKPGGKVISISGPPDVDFAKTIGLNFLFRTVMFLLSFKTKKLAKKQNVDYAFLFMQANGKQLTEISKLTESGIIKPTIDKIFPFEQTNDAMNYVESGRAKGKVVIKIK